MTVADYTLPLDQLPDPLPIVPITRPFDVTMWPPGSKSITNRVYILAALSKGESRIVRPLRSEDTDGLLDALCTLGAQARWEGDDVIITGVDGRFPRGGEVNLGDGGTPTRFMIAAACLADEPVVVDGSERMRERPISEGVDMLRQLGADIAYVEEEGRLPVRVTPSDSFKGGTLKVGKTQSSQFISAICLIMDHMPRSRRLEITRAAPFVEMTSPLYVALTHVTRDTFRKSGGTFSVPCDASSAVYWVAAAHIHGLSRVFVEDLWQCEADVKVADVLAGKKAWVAEDGAAGIGRVAPIEVDASEFPDGSLALACAAAFATNDGGSPATSTITGLHTLRVKETDRIAALANELRKIGCTIQTTDDSITIDPSTRHDEPAVIETYNDHRMAMSFAILGTARPGISIKDPGCVAKSYPGFWRDLARLYE